MIFRYYVDEIIVIDGDTFDVRLDIGMGLKIEESQVRLIGVNTPETRTRNKREKSCGLKVKNLVRRWFLDNMLIRRMLFTSQKFKRREKYGRLLGDFKPEIEGIMYSLSGLLLKNRLCKEYDGGKKKSWTDEELTIIEKYEKEVLE